jgi:predicted transcriptional regulator
MNHVYSFRLDHSTADALSMLAMLTHRSRAGVIRWLIQKEVKEQQEDAI